MVNDNLPFLLDSTLAEMVDQGYEPILVAHPILAVERDAAGALVRLVGETTAAAARAVRRESFLHIHLDRIDEPEARARLVAGLRKVYADVATAVGLGADARRIVEAIEAYRANPPPLPADEVAEALAFLEWLRPTTSPSSACANTACRRATPPPIPSRRPASAFCAIRPCGCCAAAGNSSS